MAKKMIDDELIKKWKKDKYPYHYYLVAKENLEKREEKDKWLVENYNTIAQTTSERMIWIAGVALGMLPILFQVFYPTTIIEKNLITFTILTLFISISFGIIDVFSSLSFWERTINTNTLILGQWFNSILMMKRHYPNGSKKFYLESLKKEIDLNPNAKRKSTDSHLRLQSIFALFAFLSEVIYILINIFQ